jgi:MSHA biogenesis protein MshE
MARPEKFRLGEILVQQNLLSQDQLQAALDEQKKTGRKLGRVFVDKGFVTEEQISEAIARQINAPYINLKYFNIKPAMVRLLPESQARRFRALVLEDLGTAWRVGMADPTDLFAYDEVIRILRRDIEVCVVTESSCSRPSTRLRTHRGDQRPRARNSGRDRRRRRRSSRRSASRPGRGCPGRQAAAVRLRGGHPRARLRHPHRTAGSRALHIRFRIDGVLHLQTAPRRGSRRRSCCA